MTQEKIGIPGGDVSVILGVTPALIESSADPSWNFWGKFLFFLSLFFVSSLVGRIASGGSGSDSSNQVRGPLDRQVLVREEGFFLFPVPGIGPKSLVNKITEEVKLTRASAQFGLPETD